MMAMISSAALPKVALSKSAPGRPGALGEMLGRFAHQMRQRDHAQRREDERRPPAPTVWPLPIQKWTRKASGIAAYPRG